MNFATGIASGRQDLLLKIKDFFITTCGWTVIDDKTGAGTNPYLFASNISSPNANGWRNGKSNNPQFICSFGYTSSVPAHVYAHPYLAYDGVNARGNIPSQNINTYDASDFEYQFREDDNFYSITTRCGTRYCTFLLDTFNNSFSQLEEDTFYTTLTSNMTGGSGSKVISVSDSTNFTIGNRYFMYDFDGSNFVNEVEVTDKGTGTLTVKRTGTKNLSAFKSGAVISPYAHNILTFVYDSGTSTSRTVPYVSRDYSSSEEFASVVDILSRMTNGRSDLDAASYYVVEKLKLMGSVIGYHIIDGLPRNIRQLLGTANNIGISPSQGYNPLSLGINDGTDKWCYIGGEFFIKDNR